MKEIVKNTDDLLQNSSENCPRIRGYEWDFTRWRIAQVEKEKKEWRRKIMVFSAVCGAVALVLLSALAIANAF